MRLGIFILLCSFLASCVSSKKYAEAQDVVKRLQTDSTLLEKRILALQDEVSYLANKSATIEQSLNQRLQEKQDSLIQKQDELKAKESRINDMKARKAQEQEAFSKLSGGIIKPFTGYNANEITTRTNCTQTIIEVNDKMLFMPNSSKLNMEKSAKFLSNIADILNKQPDLQVWIISLTDSVYTGKEKWDDNWALGAAKANAIVKILITDYKVAPARIIPATQAEFGEQLKLNASLGPNRISFAFYSALLPCIHTTD
jgi:chemotaxis protein MotB